MDLILGSCELLSLSLASPFFLPAGLHPKAPTWQPDSQWQVTGGVTPSPPLAQAHALVHPQASTRALPPLQAAYPPSNSTLGSTPPYVLMPGQRGHRT